MVKHVGTSVGASVGTGVGASVGTAVGSGGGCVGVAAGPQAESKNAAQSVMAKRPNNVLAKNQIAIFQYKNQSQMTKCDGNGYKI